MLLENPAPESTNGKVEDHQPATEQPSLDELKAQHYEQIVSQNKRLRESFADWKMADVDAKRLKKLYEGEAEALSDLIQRDPAQRRLPLASDTPLPADDSWRKVAVTELGLAEGVVGKLNGGGISTLGDLQDHWQAGKSLRDIKGIGESADTAVKDVFSTYGALHPEVFGQQKTEEATDDPDAELKEEITGEFQKLGILATA